MRRIFMIAIVIACGYALFSAAPRPFQLSVSNRVQHALYDLSDLTRRTADWVGEYHRETGNESGYSTYQSGNSTYETDYPTGYSCNIKGNVSYNSGRRIYHMPGDRDYERTRISSSRGERWFCSAAQAEAAGWRRAGT